MKTELTDVSDTQKRLTIEIPPDVVDKEIDRVAHGYTKQVRLPGFRPGRVPTRLIKQRFREQILNDVTQGLIPRAVDEALQERGIEPVDTPDISNVDVAEGQPLKFTAAVETVPPFEPGDLSTIAVHRPPTAVPDEAVDRAIEQLRERAAKYEVVEGRPIGEGDTVALDLERTDQSGASDRHENAAVQIGAPGNPPGFDAHLLGLQVGEEKTFVVQFPEGYPVSEMANTDATYHVTVKDIRQRVLPDLDDEFAKDLGQFESLAALRDRVRADLEAEAEEAATRHVRTEVLRQLASRISFEPPVALVDREIARRLEELARQLLQQNVDPRQAGLDWAQLRDAQREPARTSVASALVLDEIARREALTISGEDVDKEIDQFATRAGRTPAVLRAQIEKEGGLARLTAGLRREKAVDLAISRATITVE